MTDNCLLWSLHFMLLEHVSLPPDPGRGGEEEGHLSRPGAAFHEGNHGSSFPGSRKDHHCQKLPPWLWDRGAEDQTVPSQPPHPPPPPLHPISLGHTSRHCPPAGDRVVSALRFPSGTRGLWMSLLLPESASAPAGVCVSPPGAQGHLHCWQAQVGSCSDILTNPLGMDCLHHHWGRVEFIYGVIGGQFKLMLRRKSEINTKDR